MIRTLLSSAAHYLWPSLQNAVAIEPFPILVDPEPDNSALPAFMVSKSRGFLPRNEPIVQLPAEFAILQSLLDRMPTVLLDGTPGLLATGDFGATVEAELPDLRPEIKKYKSHLPVINALYREYSFMTSAYLLEPCYQRHIRGEPFGLARSTLPKEIAMPLVMVAEISGFKPWLEYAGSYALYNYKLVDPSKGLQYDNLALIRAFERGLDRESSEAGFVLVHIAMACNSGKLVTAAMDVLDGCESQDRNKLIEALLTGASALDDVNQVLGKMWTKSSSKDYATFRTFLFGILNQDMFPNGVLYEGVSNEPYYFRGGSGANDSMVPLCDNLLQVEMPNSPLTAILQDFRKYRPGNHREFLEWVHTKASTVKVKDYALSHSDSALAYLQMLDQIRAFRWRHWQLTKEYVLKQTKYKVATGGAPVVNWLPNQLQAVLTQILQASKSCYQQDQLCNDIIERAESQLRCLKRALESS